MANGVAVRLPSALDPPSASTEGKPNTPIEVLIGEATASAAEAVGWGIADYAENGVLTSTIKESCGERIARMVMLLLQHTAPDGVAFDIARTQGKRVLLQRHGAILLRHYGAIPEKALDGLIDAALEIAGRVVADERALAH